jgi:hypothetical protein
VSKEVLRITSTIVLPAKSPDGIMPSSRKVAISFSDQTSSLRLSPIGVMFGTQPLPSGAGPPAKRSLSMMPPSRLRGEWHSAQWPGPFTR